MRQTLLAACVGVTPFLCHAEELVGRSGPALAHIEARLKRCLEQSGSMLGGSGEATILVGCQYSSERNRVNDLFNLYKDQVPEIAN
jgi:hypothetical protein